MINYCVQVIVFQALFLFVYDAFLSKETFFAKNRWYLLSASVLSFIIPLMSIPALQESVPNEVSVLLPEIVLSPQAIIEQTSLSYVSLLFWSGVILSSLLFLRKVWKLSALIRSNQSEKRGPYQLIYLPNSKDAFSFFNYVFIGENIAQNERAKIIQHELVHSSQRHSLDLLLFEILKIVMWFNPLVYIYQRRVSMIHEYISDEMVVKSADKKEYMNQLINDLFDVQNISFVNQFVIGSFVKKRIKMLTREKSKSSKQFKYLLAIPLFLSMLFYISCSDQVVLKDQVTTESPVGQLDEVVIGSDSGVNNQQNKAVTTYTRVDSNDPTKTEKEFVEKVSFSTIDKIPTFPGCEENDKNCFNKNVQKHIAQNFDVLLPKKLKLAPGTKRILSLFEIDTNGEIRNVRAKAPAPELEAEFKRVIELLPTMEPGEQNGKKVTVKYTIPMRIDVE